MTHPSNEPTEAKRSSVKLMRGFKISLCVFLSIVMLLMLLIAVLNIAKQIAYREFFSTAESNVNMPGLGEGFIPQGLENYGDGFIMSGYMNSNKASRLYILDRELNYTAVELFKANGDPFTGHAGGVAAIDGYVYVGGSKGLYVFSESDMNDGDGKAAQIGFFEAGLSCAWVQLYDGYVIVVSFYDEPGHTTDPWQHVTTPSGDEHKSMILIFERDSGALYGINPAPVCALSVRNRVQGAAFTSDGVILSTSSMVSISGQPSGFAYPASKFAVNGLTVSLARELGPKGIRVNAVAPGITETDMMKAVPKEVIEPMIARIPLRRLGRPEDIANAFVFLASEEASYITGVVLSVDGMARS